ncbi:hypothetical protein BCR33DRAFT_711490 [Rhizoclosmatium globosum]|uniref:Uncharacterized protein n=1 Tax=Rhizoclosmatium globosum TaxID=329046 RepID=A0A1Y2D1Q7_9FUNG|nr:hypothetical protein BCR33DRAFT_711490 [Rhizoclosmatium globosum]|eukprot:ORY53137.1 hypothetical protein BCR33DRAFT_711490 [Rhizoclosmatium globosum]
MSSTSFAAASKKTSNRYARNEDDDGSIGRLAILPPDSPVFQTSIKGDDLAAKTLLSLSSPTSSINQNDELAAVLLGQLGYSDNDGTADDEDDGEMITYESDSSTVNGKLSRIDDIVVRAFMDLAQTTATSTAAGLAKMERRRSSAHAGKKLNKLLPNNISRMCSGSRNLLNTTCV